MPRIREKHMAHPSASPAVLHATRPFPPEVGAALGDPSRVRQRAIDRVAYASDASHVALTPNAVLVAADASEVAAVLRAASTAGSPVAFRSGGTSLSGQAATDGILVDVRQRFRRIDVLDHGARVRAQPGATIRQVNTRLARYGRRLGPDPASEIACTVGGVVSNNSSGMACGTEENTYRTLESMVFVLPSGTVIDTASPDADSVLRAAEPELVDGLLRLRSRVLSDPGSVATIRRLFAMKNTMGYGVNAFLDYERPAQLLAHLIIGSEGTLAFVAEATYRTVPLRPLAATAFALFPDLDAAARALPELVASGAAALELLDATSLRVGQRLPSAPALVRGRTVTTEAALLIEYQGFTDDEITDAVARGHAVLGSQRLLARAALSPDPAARASAWALRKGLYAAIAEARPSGTTALLEDIVVPVDALATTCADLQRLFDRHEYRDSVIFGHAKDGNIHFMLTDDFGSARGLDRYGAFTEDMVELVLNSGGNLKAEHGTGRVMAPYVRRQYGDELYEVMRELKRLCDPRAILNPGVLIDDDPHAHLAHIKPTETVEDEVDRCVECGYCEPTCPSKDLTLTPRQRIVTRRAIVRARAAGDDALARELERDYEYAGVQTCAVDGMCAASCPVSINTGALVKRLRREDPAPVENAVWSGAARAWGPATRTGSAALTIARALPSPVVAAASTVARAVVGADAVPSYDGGLPRGGAARAPLAPGVGDTSADPVAIYLPSCVNSMFGPEGEGAGATGALVRLAERAGVHLLVPAGIESMCCGTPWSSKGIPAGHRTMARRVLDAVQEIDPEGRLPVISDAASCTEGFAHVFEGTGIQTEDAVAFAVRALLPRLPEPRRAYDLLALHPTCSSHHLGIDPALRTLAESVANRVTVPDAWGCCAFAGDRGMLHPELTASATAAEASEVIALGADVHASCNRTCEIGMTRAVGVPYRNVLELLEEATRPSDDGE